MATRTLSEKSDTSLRLENLYAIHAPEALRLAYLLTGDSSLAEDMVQDAFVRVAGRLVKLSNVETFGPYLRRTILNLHFSRLRRRRLERVYVSRMRGERTATREIPDIETRDDLIRFLRELPAKQHAALVLRYCEDLSEEQVARSLGCSRAAAKSLIARGLKNLRPKMREVTNGE
jgi:RNA polymerase sigma-70 factor (sigma-E family)